jgi:large-conductance mechanosensitive channel
MEEPSSQLSPSDSKKWILRIILALVLGQAIWGLVVSLTSNLIVPLTARVMGNDPNSPLYLGKGEIDVPLLFISIVEFCLGGIVAVILNSSIQKTPKIVRRKVSTAGSLSLQPSPAPPAPPNPLTAPVMSTAVPRPPAKPVQAAPAPVPAPVAATATSKPAPQKPEKPKPPKQIYYNSVGDPIVMDDD